MLKQIRPSLPVGEKCLDLIEIQVSQKLVFGGSIKVSLKEAIALTSKSELNIEAIYRDGAIGVSSN